MLQNSSPCTDPAGIYLLKVNNRNTRNRFDICLKLPIKIPERRHWPHSGIFIINFQQISHLFLVFLLLTLNMQLPAGELIFSNKPDFIVGKCKRHANCYHKMVYSKLNLEKEYSPHYEE